MKFELDNTDGLARRGRMKFDRRGVEYTVETPAFMPVGTYGTVKGYECLYDFDMRSTKISIIMKISI